MRGVPAAPPAGRAAAAVVVLAGGGGTRFAARAAGADKLAAPLGSSDVLRHLLAHLTPCWPVVLVGPDRVAGVPAVREEPPGGGPLAGFAAGLAALDAGVPPGAGCPVVLLGGDQPFAASAVPRLLEALAGDADAAVGVDASGRRQPLLSAYRRAHARAVVASLPVVAGRPVRELLGARGARVVEVPLEAHEHLDVDVPEDLARARALLAGPGASGAGAGGAPRT
ncbi:NTP transferase domain-containing protein [Paenibacillus sp. TRM 82003]|uniref:molybdenum cofactor guanylyltransferase n=1 Tax=Kineococcus sp. TRM81007 TaxID=2925831 RepID=UPI001F570003|nr:NTP transferase domain-containing protein [Kineococcus sp. TRM81007]MCI2238039.1 NTP transferase domain-containing protein [Kineococcus sp. TRM81007]MCI3926054.1 NTP transferase domain-containing protein [Paenibacillus sp. TRM 82003]